VGADGGVFTFSDAHFKGSLGATPPNAAVTGIAVNHTTLGSGSVEALQSSRPLGTAAPPLTSAPELIAVDPVSGVSGDRGGLLSDRDDPPGGPGGG
jgi:hypothetical protein